MISKIVFPRALERPEARCSRRRADTLMPLRESEAIVLQSYPLGEADRLVSFLSRAMGRVRGVASGARRVKSRFGSTLERMSHVRIWFFERETRELVRINQCELIESFVEVFADYSAGVGLALLAEITETVLPEREASDASFRLLLLAAQSIKRQRAVEIPLAYFALWTLRLGGWLAPLERCSRCGRDLSAGDVYATASHSGFFCATCVGAGTLAISPAAMALGRRMLAARLEQMEGEKALAGAARELKNYLFDLLENQIERKLVSRRMLEQ